MSALPSNIIDALNEQIKMEAYASQFYLSLTYWCDDKGLRGCKAFFQRQTEEEREHMLKIFEYMSELGEKPKTPSVEQPPLEFGTIKEVFQKVLDQERNVTKSIHAIVKMSYEANDFNTLNFLQWFVDEQREEESMIQEILDRIEIIGDGAQSLYYIDKEVDAVNKLVTAGEG